MTTTTTDAPARDWRSHALTQPEAILDDPAIMRALVKAQDGARGGNVLDLRGAALDRLSARLERLEEVHDIVVANAYDNVAGTAQIHRAVTSLTEADCVPALLDRLHGDLPSLLRVESIRLVTEGAALPDHPAVARRVPGTIRGLLGVPEDVPLRGVTLREGRPLDHALHGTPVESEAFVLLDNDGGDPDLLALGSSCAEMFRPGQGTDLLAFLGGCAERLLRRLPL